MKKPMGEVLTAFEVGRLRPELLINSGPLAFFVWENREGWPVKDVSDSVYELTEYTKEEFLNGVIDYAKLIHRPIFPYPYLSEFAHLSKFLHLSEEACTFELCTRTRRDGTLPGISLTL